MFLKVSNIEKVWLECLWWILYSINLLVNPLTIFSIICYDNLVSLCDRYSLAALLSFYWQGHVCGRISFIKFRLTYIRNQEQLHVFTALKTFESVLLSNFSVHLQLNPLHCVQTNQFITIKVATIEYSNRIIQNIGNILKFW